MKAAGLEYSRDRAEVGIGEERGWSRAGAEQEQGRIRRVARWE